MDRHRLPKTAGLRIVAGVVAFQAFGLLVQGVLTLVLVVLANGGFGSRNTNGSPVNQPLLEVALYVTFVVLLGLVLRGLLRGRWWARTPALLTQVFAVLVGWPLLTGPTWWLGALLVVPAVVAAVLLLTPAVAAELENRAR